MVVKTLCVFGTRPEAIKMARVIKQLQTNTLFCNKICVTGQHQRLLNAVLNVFELVPDYNLHVMTEDQSLSELNARILTGLVSVFKQYQPDLVLVHGDTSTTLATALSSYYHHIPIAHVEAGLRTGDLYSPWPEEANRKLTGALATLHFAPTESSRNNLLREGIDPSTIHVTGNTVIDSLHAVVGQIDNDPRLRDNLKRQVPFLSFDRRIILVTGHRRENFGQGLEQICQAIAQIARLFPDVDIVYPVHLNPEVQRPVKSLLADIQNVYLIDPLDYILFVFLLQSAYIILTDSGGIQEEAASLGKALLLMRENTERAEAMQAGTAKFVGTDTKRIIDNVTQLLTDPMCHRTMSQSKNFYGDGNASARIVQIIADFFAAKKEDRPLANFLETVSVE